MRLLLAFGRYTYFALTHPHKVVEYDKGISAQYKGYPCCSVRSLPLARNSKHRLQSTLIAFPCASKSVLRYFWPSPDLNARGNDDERLILSQGIGETTHPVSLRFGSCKAMCDSLKLPAWCNTNCIITEMVMLALLTAFSCMQNYDMGVC